MKTVKNTFTDSELESLARKFKTMSEPSRLKILRTLSTGEKCVTDVINATKLLQANVSKQLKILQGAGIVSCRPAGLQRFYKLEDKRVMEVCGKMCDEPK